MNFEKRKFYIKTLGCKANQLESAVIAEKLCSAGYEQTYKHNEAQIYILNSCSVTENADIDALRLYVKFHINILDIFQFCQYL